MTQQGENVKTVGTRTMTAGTALLIFGVVVIAVNLFVKVEKYVPGVGMVEMPGTPSGGAIFFAVAGLVILGIGFARRFLAAVERR